MGCGASSGNEPGYDADAPDPRLAKCARSPPPAAAAPAMPTTLCRAFVAAAPLAIARRALSSAQNRASVSRTRTVTACTSDIWRRRACMYRTSKNQVRAACRVPAYPHVARHALVVCEVT